MKLPFILVVFINFQIIKTKILEVTDDFHTPSFPFKAFDFVRGKIGCNGSHDINFYVNHTETVNVDNFLRTFSNSSPIYVKSFEGELSKLKDVKNLKKNGTIHVFIVQNTSRAKNVINLISRRVYTKHYQKYFVIIQEAFIEDLNWLEIIFRDFFDKEILNIVAIFYNSERVYSFTYHPYTSNGFKLINLSERSCTEYFFEKLTNLFGHRIKISMLTDNIKSVKSENGKYKGTDGYLASTIEEILNATFEYITPNKNSYGAFINNTATGGLADVIYRKADMSFNNRFLNPAFLDYNVETTNSYKQENVCIMVPKATRKSTFYNLFYIFTIPAWLSIIFLIFFVTGTLKIYQTIHFRFNQNRNEIKTCSWIEIFFQVLRAFIGEALSVIKTSNTTRLIIGGWILYSFLITSSFSGKLVSKLVNPLYGAEIETFEQLFESELNIVLSEGIHLVAKAQVDKEIYEKLKPRFVYVAEQDEAYFHFINNKSISAHISNMYRLDIYLQKNFDSTGRSHYHIMRECLIYFPSTYITSEGSQFLGRINDLISRFHETGLVSHWEMLTNINTKVSGEIVELNDDEEEEEFKVILTIDHLQSAFYLWILGIFISCLAFCWELSFIPDVIMINMYN